MPLPRGQHLGPYKIVSLLGTGGMGEVYKAKDLRLRRDVAIKVLNEKHSAKSMSSARLRREAMAAASVSHPHICTLYDIGEKGGVGFIVMEFLDGETLAARLARTTLAISDAISIGISICEALAAAHSQGLIHRDLKPANVMLTRLGPKLLDFGLAHIRSASVLEQRRDTTATAGTASGMLLGTLQYMAPEQLECGSIDHRADIFSFGAVLYEMLSRKRAFEGDSRAATILAILRGDPPSIRALRPEVSAALAAVIKTCLAKKAGDRWQNASDLAAALRAVMASRRRMESSSTAKPVNQTIRSLAVLPLQNASGDPKQQYLAEGMTDTLSTSMATIGRLRVISRNSAVKYRGTDQALESIAAELGVDAFIQGSVWLSSSAVTVRVALIRPRSTIPLWSHVYERPMTDLFRVQGEIAETIAAEIHLQLTPSERRRFRAQRSTLPEVTEAYLRGRYYWTRETPEGLKQSFQHLSIAVQRDPDYAPAHAALADWYLSAGNHGLMPASDGIMKAKVSALRALDLDAGLAEAYACLGRVAMHEWDLQRARAEFETAMRLSPNLVEPVIWSARASGYLGMHDEAIKRAEHAKQLDPVSPRTYLAASAVYYIAGQYERAIEESRRALEFEPRLPIAYYYMGTSQLRLGAAEDATISLTKAVDVGNRHPAALAGLAAVLATTGRTADALRVIEEMKDRATRAEVSPYYFAEVYLALGDVTKALEYLDRSYELRIPDMIGIGVDPLFYRLHSHPEFQDILRRLAVAPPCTTAAGGEAVS